MKKSIISRRKFLGTAAAAAIAAHRLHHRRDHSQRCRERLAEPVIDRLHAVEHRDVAHALVGRRIGGDHVGQHVDQARVDDRLLVGRERLAASALGSPAAGRAWRGPASAGRPKEAPMPMATMN